MCKLKCLPNGRAVAEIKYKYIENIITQAAKCKNISRIMLFGSALEERCHDASDIDIAVFGESSKAKYLKSKEFKEFQKNLFLFGDAFSQDYDILYFCEDGKNSDSIMEDIEKGAEIYRRKVA
ncbi:nucleotidyltransferase domain-containing protein [Phascolarctobacterium sp.]|uniref:nucleotidyltransferase domain-containing protein n=1 Tax=Phascolarctobacterium sp. TaxID=2049039 RepID=UPI00386EDA7D